MIPTSLLCNPEITVKYACFDVTIESRIAPHAGARSAGMRPRQSVSTDQAAMQIAGEIAAKAPLAVYGCKRMINYARDHSTVPSCRGRKGAGN